MSNHTHCSSRTSISATVVLIGRSRPVSAIQTKPVRFWDSTLAFPLRWVFELSWNQGLSSNVGKQQSFHICRMNLCD